MKGDIALAGFVLTAEEWEALDPTLRAQLLEASGMKNEFAVVSGSGQRAQEAHGTSDAC